MASRIANVSSKIPLPQPLLVKITLARCALHNGESSARETLRVLGLKHINQSVLHKNIRPIRGMINAVKEFVTVQPINVIPKNSPAAKQ